MLAGVSRPWLKENSGLDYEDDIKPALGDEVDLVWLDFGTPARTWSLTTPKDEDAFTHGPEREQHRRTT
jgi:hypothetical protein